MKLLIAWDVFSGCAWYRCVLPGHEATLAGHEVRLRQAFLTPQDIAWCDVLYVQRMFERASIDFINQAKSCGKRVVYDLDDDLWSIGPHNSAYEHWEKHGADAAFVMGMADCVTTTQPYLAEVLRDYNDDVRVVPNALSRDWRRVRSKHRGVVIGWAGSTSHSEDIAAIAPMLYRFLDLHPDVRFEWGGGDEEWLIHPSITYLGTQRIELYHHLLSRFDIGIAPLTDNHFNRCKSDLKVLEYAGLSMPCVASAVGPYLDTPARLASNEDEWMAHLHELVSSASKRNSEGQRLAQWARHTTDTLPLWEDAWTREPTPGATSTSDTTPRARA